MIGSAAGTMQEQIVFCFFQLLNSRCFSARYLMKKKNTEFQQMEDFL